MTRSFETIQDEILVLAAQAGDAAAFEALLRRWLPVMRRHAVRLTGDAAAAEDVSQEACLALVGALPRLHDPALARGWMLRIVTHKAADWARRRRRDRELTRAIQNREPRTAPSDFQSEGGSHERAALIRAACMNLPTGLRALVSLYYGEGMSVAVIADGLGIPAGTVKSRLHQARAQLKAILERNSA
jgi:RNA polymerase sigma-70 factor (ECF subfamily)